MFSLSHDFHDDESRIARLLRDRRLLCGIWAVIVAECIGAFLLIRPAPFGDSVHYLALADNLQSGRYGTVTAAGFEPDPLRPPAYPILLWFLQHVIGLPLSGVIALQLGAYAGTLALVQAYLRSIRINPVIFLAGAAIYPFPLIYSSYLFTEAWTTLLLTAAALLVAVRRSPAFYAAAGALTALAALFRADLVLMPLVLFAVVLTVELLAGSRRLAALIKAILPVVAAGLVLLPYAAWNYSKFDAFTPMPRAGAVGTSLYLSTWQRKMTYEDLWDAHYHRAPPGSKAAALVEGFAAVNRSIGAPEDIVAFDPWAYPTVALRIAASKAFVKAAIERIEADPATYAKHVLFNSWELWNTKKYPPGTPLLVEAGLKFVSWAVFLLSIAGMIAAVLRPKRWALPWTLVPVTLYPAAIHVWLHTEARYTASARILLLLFAAAFVGWAIRRYLDGSRGQSAL